MKTQSQDSECKRNKSNEKHEQQGRSLNDFPDAILCHILSFVPTDVAVSTSVLSKCWRFMWTSLSALDFRERTLKDVVERALGLPNATQIKRKNFMDFVERVLRLNNAPLIKKISLSCDVVEDDICRIKTWISTAVSRNIQKLYIDLTSLPVNDHSVFPECLFNSKMLEALHIVINFKLLLPQQISLPNLKKLTFENVTFKDYHPLNILFGSLALEELFFYSCRWKMDAPGELIITSPKLQSLGIYELDCYVSANQIGLDLSSVMVFSLLTTFEYYGQDMRDFRFSCPSSIVKAAILFTNSDDAHHFHELLRSLRFVKYLELPFYADEAPSFATLPIFESLTSLELTEMAVDLNCKEMETFLNKFPLLKTLKLSQGVFEKYDEDYDINDLCPKFLCLTSLENITIGRFEGYMKELLLVQILVEKATSLKTLELELECAGLSEEQKIKSFLSSNIPWESNSCTLKFLN